MAELGYRRARSRSLECASPCAGGGPTALRRSPRPLEVVTRVYGQDRFDGLVGSQGDHVRLRSASTDGLDAVSAVGGALLFVTGGAVPTLRLFLARARRSRQISEQLPSALEMMARSLRAGHSLTSAFKLVAAEMPGPINLEFARAYEEQNLGVSFYRAVQQMTSRVPANSDLNIFAVSVIVQKETGGNLVELLEKLADTIRARYQFYGKLAALTAEGEASGLVLGALPIATAVFLMFVNFQYISALVTKPMGRVILTYTMISWFVGLIWLRQMGKVEY